MYRKVAEILVMGTPNHHGGCTRSVTEVASGEPPHDVAEFGGSAAALAEDLMHGLAG